MDSDRPRLLQDRNHSALRTHALHLAGTGAVLTMGDGPSVAYLVGAMRWSEGDPGCLHFFAGNGEDIADGHTLRFDEMVPNGSGLRFRRDGEMIGSLAPIDEADVGDRDDYRVGWQIWRQVFPLKRAQIDEVFDALERRTRAASPAPRDQ